MGVEMKDPFCGQKITDNEGRVVCHEECVNKLIVQRDLYARELGFALVALEAILEDYKTISYQTDCIVAMWSKAKRARDAIVHAVGGTGDDAADLGRGVRPRGDSPVNGDPAGQG